MRNTPTCVGKTGWPIPIFCLEKKHPHVRGEDQVGLVPHIEVTETPPRAWGRHQYPPCQTMRGRNTPTCVGKTASRHSRAASFQKHPHVRGEDRFQTAS